VTGAGKLVSEAADRNREPILAVLRRVLPPRGNVLEIASGSGQHAVHFARHLPALTWQPSDVDPRAVDSIRAWAAEAALPNLLPPVWLDVRTESWPVDRAAAILSINLLHISEWSCCEALFRGASRTVAADGIVFLYGPYRMRDRPTAPSNERFDESLRQRNPDWGLRWLEDVGEVAQRFGFGIDERVEMPANNVSVVLSRREVPA
jgi:hypothetical protein